MSQNLGAFPVSHKRWNLKHKFYQVIEYQSHSCFGNEWYQNCLRHQKMVSLLINRCNWVSLIFILSALSNVTKLPHLILILGTIINVFDMVDFWNIFNLCLLCIFLATDTQYIDSIIWWALLILLPLSIKYCIWCLALALSWLHWSLPDCLSLKRVCKNFKFKFGWGQWTF